MANTEVAPLHVQHGVLPDVVAVALATACQAALPTIYDFLHQDSDLSSLAAAVDQAGLKAMLSGSQKLTLFAANNNGFSQIDTKEKTCMFNNTSNLSEVLQYSMLNGVYLQSQLPNNGVLPSIEGQSLFFQQIFGQIIIDSYSLIVKPNITLSNGVVHVMNMVVLPDDHCGNQ